jgi:hypothetical protein
MEDKDLIRMAMETVFASGDFSEDGFDYVMSKDYDTDEGFGDSYVVSVLFQGWSNSFICDYIQSTLEDYRKILRSVHE